ncbi:MAG: hypothetical protein ACRDQA_18070 [Nocardioidaceae bacterium]
MDRPCSYCGKQMPITARSHAKTCSPGCRKAASRSRNTPPPELRKLARWVRHDDRKRPLQAASGRYASSTDPSTWTTYSAALASGHGVGVGFVLNGDGVVCIDLDHCIADGVIAPWAQAILDSVDSYAEYSRSGEGIHIFGYAQVTAGRRIRDGRNIEIYGTGRYIAMTCDHVAGRFTLGDISSITAKER